MTEPHRVVLTEVWLCTCGKYFLEDKQAREHIHEPPFDPARAQWRPTHAWEETR